MPFMRSAFARLLEPLDRRVIAGAVAAHGGDHGVGGGAQAWTCERHLKALLFAQFAGLSSLRQIVEALGSQSASFYHLNLRAPCRSTLADANRGRPWQVFRDIAAALLPVTATALRRDGEALIRLLDASPIPLKDARLAWPEAGARTRGLKLHLLYDPRHGRPVWFAVSGAKTDDVVAGRTVPLEPRATYVFDKGYTDFRWWAEIRAAGAFFVTRRKYNTCRRDIVEQPAAGDTIVADRRLKIGHRRPHAGAARNPLWDVELREVVVARADKAEPLYLLTNDFERPAAEIARLYKERWEIELLFKWLKQNLKIRRFLGRSENAVRTQIYIALIAFMLLRILHNTAARAVKTSTARLLVQLKIALLRPLDLRKLGKPPPRPPCLRPPHNQFTLAFQ